MKREKRRIRLARRQALLAEACARAAMRGLADALEQEHRSRALAVRSLALVESYSGRPGAPDGAAVAHAVAFTGALARLANEADAARADAEQQAGWQAQALGEAQTRARRLLERLGEALSADRIEREKRHRDPALEAFGARSGGTRQGLARLVQSENADARHKRTTP